MCDDVTFDHHMHVVGCQLVEETLTTRDVPDTHLRTASAHFTNAFGGDVQGIDVESGVGPVENGLIGFEERHVDVTVDERRVHAESLIPVIGCER